ncbi:sialate O-acetylesterase isoform X4 [Physeter macrocephalus]|uniref:Sialate O-acetylesterase isoform X4 n=1 Tax=Physeter macrocephalus TaxID=9755 RepID=A0A2Y9F9Q4_PHYMC|nr:sialate O-acetylesterase isoform X4 [Physeter catodon]|eukprot:XP_007117994.1 sialate O-acetylesterase isoform X3 [Physeter catodon]
MVAPGFVFGLVLPLLLRADSSADVGFRFASYIDNYMVLQKEPAGAVIWGYGVSGATVTVTLCQDQETIMKKVTSVKAHSNSWMVVLDPVKAGGPYEVMAQQILGRKNFTLRIHDVLFGDVWLCSGQSNMQMTVSQIFNATSELSNTAAYQSVRILSVSLSQAQQELEDLAKVDLQWSKPTLENLGHGNFTYMSAVCWLFGRYLHDTLRYPVGLLSSSWAGTPIEAWSSGRSLKACGVPRQGFMPSDLETGPSECSVLWNAMIHPLRNMTLKGVIWYQGTCTIVRSRHSLKTGARPSTMAPRGRQSASSHLDLSSTHPRDKQTVAYRLHLGARAVAYGAKLTFQGPLPQKIELLGNMGLLNLTYSQPIQVQRHNNKIFEISCCSDHQCKWLPAPMDTFSTQTLALNVKSCHDSLVAVRYAWTTWPCEYKQCPLYHPTSALPAPPFTAFITNQIPGYRSKVAK